MSERSRLKSKFLGGMVGAALGDAIGELAFSHRDQAALSAQVAREDTLVYTDDTAMAIGLAESIIEVGRLDPEHLGNTFRAHFHREPWRGYASGPPTIFAMVERQGLSYLDAARKLFGGQGSFGNGAAMRIVPVGLFFYDDCELYEQVRASATVTHAHPIGVDGAAILAWAISRAVGIDPEEPFPVEDLAQGLVNFARTAQIKAKMEQLRDILEGATLPQVAVRRLGRGVGAHESVPFSLYSFLRHPASFEECLFCAVLNGGDRDTMGAMACAVSGAYLGVEAIPSGWRDKLEQRTYIEELALRLAERRGSESGTRPQDALPPGH